MTGTVDLGGSGWQVREALGLTWQWYVAAPLVRSAWSPGTPNPRCLRLPQHDRAVAGRTAVSLG